LERLGVDEDRSLERLARVVSASIKSLDSKACFSPTSLLLARLWSKRGINPQIPAINAVVESLPGLCRYDNQLM